jgi:hypothetical protein
MALSDRLGMQKLSWWIRGNVEVMCVQDQQSSIKFPPFPSAQAIGLCSLSKIDESRLAIT